MTTLFTLTAGKNRLKNLWQVTVLLLLLCSSFGQVLASAHEKQTALFLQATAPNATENPIKKGTFLVATKKLFGTSFNKTVILLTNYSSTGATGLAINRPANMSLHEAFPEINQLKGNKSELYLGGPVRSEALFILVQTKNPENGMRKITDDLYFAPGIKAFGKDKSSTSSQNTRAFAGYTGWAPGQLEHEIRRGDWQVVQSKLNIVFKKNDKSLWETLTKSWSGKWI